MDAISAVQHLLEDRYLQNSSARASRLLQPHSHLPRRRRELLEMAADIEKKQSSHSDIGEGVPRPECVSIQQDLGDAVLDL